MVGGSAGPVGIGAGGGCCVCRMYMLNYCRNRRLAPACQATDPNRPPLPRRTAKLMRPPPGIPPALMKERVSDVPGEPIRARLQVKSQGAPIEVGSVRGACVQGRVCVCVWGGGCSEGSWRMGRAAASLCVP